MEPNPLPLHVQVAAHNVMTGGWACMLLASQSGVRVLWSVVAKCGVLSMLHNLMCGVRSLMLLLLLCCLV